MSLIGGYAEGRLIGAAFGATFVLAKTEDNRSETPIEEDYWVAGLEWLESMGVDVVSSSLGYNGWYEYSDMDGKTAVTTRAADIIAAKGVVVVNSMGNEADDDWYYMNAPADGNNVISVGGVNSLAEINGFSSRGPTFDGRIKPDVMAMGSSVFFARPYDVSSYQTGRGTSFSTPVVAGIAALVLQAHPCLTPFQVRDALRETASRSQSPDNDYGWGVVNAYDAVFYHGMFFSEFPEVKISDEGYQIKIKLFSKNEINTESLFIYYTIDGLNFNSIGLNSTEIDFEFQAWLPKQDSDIEIKFYFSVRDENNNIKEHPYRAPGRYFTFNTSESLITAPEPFLPEKMYLNENFPNPFNRYTIISYDIFQPGEASLIIYNIQGQQVKVLAKGYHERKNYKKVWAGFNDKEQKVASGLYFYQLSSGSSSSIKRMVYLR